MPVLTRLIRGCALLLPMAAVPSVAQNFEGSTKMEVVHGKPHVMVMVNGRGPYRFLLDTGTGGEALVTPELANELNLATVGSTRLTDPSLEGNQRSDLVFIDSLNVAGVEFPEVKAVRHTLYGEDAGCQGILGFTLFTDHLLTLDYPNQQMTLTLGSLAPDGGRTVLPFHIADGVPVAALMIGDLRVEALLDTGGTGLSLPQRLASRMKFSIEPVDFGHGESLSSRFLIKAAKLGTDVRLGQYVFTQPFVEINEAFPLANFGSNPMQNFAVTFDQVNLLVRFEAVQKILHLDTTPGDLRMQNAPRVNPPPQALVPVG
jgi:predicted aspartyl protease